MHLVIGYMLYVFINHLGDGEHILVTLNPLVDF